MHKSILTPSDHVRFKPGAVRTPVLNSYHIIQAFQAITLRTTHSLQNRIGQPINHRTLQNILLSTTNSHNNLFMSQISPVKTQKSYPSLEHQTFLKMGLELVDYIHGIQIILILINVCVQI